MFAFVLFCATLHCPCVCFCDTRQCLSDQGALRASRGTEGPFHCSWLSVFRTPTLKNLQKGMPPNGPSSLRNIILLKIDSFYYDGVGRLYSYIKTLLLLELEF